ncbi:MAG TPA: holo-ACP synthase [Motilibacterales bacterium]|nr:holo-ACP synthase [Motilibacterales bacterium]
MAVRALGIDLVGVESFAEQLGSVGSAFAEGTFTVGELRRAAGGSSGAAQHLAGRYAAKEAFVKAFSGARPGRAPVIPDMDWRQVEVVADGWGRPTLVLHGELAAAVRATLGEIVVHVSITHEPTMAAAVVVIEGA